MLLTGISTSGEARDRLLDASRSTQVSRQSLRLDSRSQVSYRCLHSLARASIDDDGCTLVCQHLRNCEFEIPAVAPVTRARLPAGWRFIGFSMPSVDTRLQPERQAEN